MQQTVCSYNTLCRLMHDSRQPIHWPSLSLLLLQSAAITCVQVIKSHTMYIPADYGTLTLYCGNRPGISWSTWHPTKMSVKQSVKIRLVTARRCRYSTTYNDVFLSYMLRNIVGILLSKHDILPFHSTGMLGWHNVKAPKMYFKCSKRINSAASPDGVDYLSTGLPQIM